MLQYALTGYSVPLQIPAGSLEDQHVKRHLGTALAVVAAASANSYANEQEGLQVELTPYAWLAGIDGEITARGRQVDFEQSFSDLIDNVDAGLMGLGIVTYNRWVLLGQYDYMSLGANGDALDDTGIGAVVPGTRVDGNQDVNIGTVAGGYRFDTFGENTIDVLVGVRDISIETELRALGTQRENEADLTDNILMLRPSFRISKNWRFNPTLSYAFSGDSDDHYELSPQVQYQFSDSFAARFGYRRLNYEVSEGNEGTIDFNEFDGSLSGFMIGVGWTFPTRQEPIVAAAPTPRPAPAPKPAPAPVAQAPADSDGDGIADTQDQCPDTPRGSRVDPRGCGCDVNIQLQFEFDSAELTEADKAALDTAAAQLVQLRFIGGVAEGYSDSVGDADYNLRLSERRARSVVDYLASKDVSAERTRVVGDGEANPVADNATEDGRAQNRRVVLRRTDC